MNEIPVDIQQIIADEHLAQEAAEAARREEERQKSLEARKQREREFAELKALILPIIPDALRPYTAMPEDVEGVNEDLYHPIPFRRMTKKYLAIDVPGLAPMILSVVIDDDGNISQNYSPEIRVPNVSTYHSPWDDWDDGDAFVRWDWSTARRGPLEYWKSALLAAADAQQEFSATQRRLHEELEQRRKQREADEKQASEESAAISHLAQLITDDPVLRMLVLAFRAVQTERSDFYQRLDEIENAAMSAEEGLRRRLASVEHTAEEYQRQKENLQSEVFELEDALKDAKRGCRPW